MPDPFRHVIGVNASLARLVQRTGRLPTTLRLASRRRGGVPVRLQGWHAVMRAHEVLLELPSHAWEETVQTALAWAEFDPPLAAAWQAAGCTRPWRALGYAEAGIDAEDGVPWTDTILSAEDVALFIAHGWSVRQAQRLRRFEPFLSLSPRTRSQRRAWISSGLPARTIEACLAAEVTLTEFRARPTSVSTLRLLAALRGQGSQ